MHSYYHKIEAYAPNNKNISYNSNPNTNSKILVSREKNKNQNLFYKRKDIPLDKQKLEHNRSINNRLHENIYSINNPKKQILCKKKSSKLYSNYKNNSLLLFKNKNYSSYFQNNKTENTFDCANSDSNYLFIYYIF